MLFTYCTISIVLSSLIITALAYPQHDRSNSARADKFIIGSMGDSWASGVRYWFSNYYDDDKKCLRYKYAWSTVVEAEYSKWAPANAPSEAQLEFRACSGSHLGDDIKNQMDLMSRPKLVLMEAGGNNANFYPLADACLFHAEGKDYRETYENDKGPPGNRQSECRREIDLVRGRLTGKAMADFQDEIKNQIHAWRGHKSVVGNDATLLTVGYARFFAEGPECNGWTFNVPFTQPQYVVLEMRKEINELIGLMNTAIRTATESFKDEKIQYVDIDPAFEGHRFCEPNSSRWDQFNINNNVWIWNQPTKASATIRQGDDVKTYERGDGDTTPTFPPEDLYESLIGHQFGPIIIYGDWQAAYYQDPKKPDTIMTIQFKAKGEADVLNGSKSRTLHPTQLGHKAMGDLIVQRLKQVMQGSKDPAMLPQLCPSGCTCNGAVPLCT